MNSSNGKSNKTGQELRLASDALDWLFTMPPVPESSNAPTEGKRIVYIGRHGGFTLMVVQSQRGLEVTIGRSINFM